MATTTRTFIIRSGVGPAGASEGVDILSTGESGGTKFLGEDGDGTSSWKALAGGGDMLAANNLSDVADAPTSLSNLGAEPAKGVDDNFVTDAEKVVIGNTSGSNSGDETTETVRALNALMDDELASIADVKALDQSVISGAAPTFVGTNISGDAQGLNAGTSNKLIGEIKVTEAGGVVKGDLIYVSGASGANTLGSLADNTDFTKVDVLAICNEAGANNDFIEVIIIGKIEGGIDTSAFTDGQIAYLGAAGAFTPTHPTGTDAVVRVGHVTRVHATLGAIIFFPESQTVVDDFDGTVRHQLVNCSAGTSAAGAYTVVNDANHYASISLTGSNFPTFTEVAGFYSQGYGAMRIHNDGNHPIEFVTDTTDAHAFAATVKMTLTAAGELQTQCQSIVHTALAADDHALEIGCDADDFGDVKAIDIAYRTGAIAAGQDEAVILTNVNQLDATGGTIVGHEILATDGGADRIYGQKAGVGVGPILQESGVFINPTTGTNNTASTDVADMIDGSEGTNTTIFVADNDYVIFGAAAAFIEIEFNVETPVDAPGIQPTFEYSTVGAGQWTAFSPIDGTNGFRNTGVIAWDAEDLTGHTTNDDTGTFDIRITRTHNSRGSASIFYAKTAAGEEFHWDENGDLVVNDISAEDITATGTISGTLVSTEVVTAIDDATLTDAGTPAATDQVLIKDASTGALQTADFSEFGGSGGGITLGTAVATTSGTSIDFTGIPAGTERITIMMDAVSTDGTSVVIIQLGDSGGVEATGYSGTTMLHSSSAKGLLDNSTGFNVVTAMAAFVAVNSVIVLNRMDGNKWISHQQGTREDDTINYVGNGLKDLSAELDRIRLTTVGGSDAFDAGSMNISYE